MSSLIRNIQRRHARKLAGSASAAEADDAIVTPQRTFALADGGYGIIHPTKGIRRISARRLAAQGHLAEIQAAGNSVQQQSQFGQIIRAMGRSQTTEGRIDDLLKAPVPVVTRQMRRLALRTGRPMPMTIAEATAASEVVADKVKSARKPRAKKSASVQPAAA